MKPEIGKTYKFYDDGKVSYARQFDATVLRIISDEEAKSIMFPLYWDYWKTSKTTHINDDAWIPNEKKSLYDVWKKEVAEDDDTYNTFTDCFVECSIPEYDDNTIWFVRGQFGWFSINIQSDWQAGRLDIDNKITEELDEFDQRMAQESIENKLTSWFSQMLEKYNGLTIKYEYSTKHNGYLVSFSADSSILKNDEFSKEAMAFEDKMTEDYGDYAPLFCDNEELFKLSSNAKVLTNKKIN